MKKIMLAAIALAAFSVTGFGQSNADADKILNDLLNSAKTSAIRTNFKLEVTIKADPQPHTTTGSFTLKGNRFTLDMPQMKVWFNGKTQWAYSAQSNEVSITEPTEKELAETNPLAIIAGFRSKSTARLAAGNKNPLVHLIEMIPSGKKSEITRIEIAIDKSKGTPVSIKTISVNGSISTLKLYNFQKGIAIADSQFSFEPSRFKGANINDLR